MQNKSFVLSQWNAVTAVSLTVIKTVEKLQALRTNSFNQNNYCRTRFWLLAFIGDTRLNLRAWCSFRLKNPANITRWAGLQSGVKTSSNKGLPDSDRISKNPRIDGGVCGGRRGGGGTRSSEITAEQT